MKTVKYLSLALLLASAVSCHWAREKSKAAVGTGGEIVGEASTAFAKGVVKGAEKTYSNEFVISDDLRKAGLSSGQITMQSAQSGGNENILSTYLIYNEAINRDVTVKLFTDNGLEYGRQTRHIQGTKGSAGFVDFIFEDRTNIDQRGKITIE